MNDLQRKRDLAKIHLAKKDLAMADDPYRALLRRVTGKSSAAKLSHLERAQVLSEFGRLGWKPKASDKPMKTYHKPISRKVAALWSELYKVGKVQNRTDTALRQWASSTLKQEVISLDWLEPEDAATLVEGLKAWKARGAKA